MYAKLFLGLNFDKFFIRIIQHIQWILITKLVGLLCEITTSSDFFVWIFEYICICVWYWCAKHTHIQSYKWRVTRCLRILENDFNGNQMKKTPVVKSCTFWSLNSIHIFFGVGFLWHMMLIGIVHFEHYFQIRDLFIELFFISCSTYFTPN